jgi:thiamine-phosphate pyrophosphorylase
MMRLPRLYAVADSTFGEPMELAKALFSGGAMLVQVRHKGVATRTLMDAVDEILKLAPEGAQVIVNDRADVARLSGATGVHLGQEDLSPSSARCVLAEGQVIGYSTHNLAQALAAEREPVDYIAVGPIFATATKAISSPVVGTEQLREICSRVRKPVVAIGGITLESVREVLECGAASVAVISDILRWENVAERTRRWVRGLEF